MTFITNAVAVDGWPALRQVTCDACGRPACCYTWNTTSAQVVRWPMTGRCAPCHACQQGTCHA